MKKSFITLGPDLKTKILNDSMFISSITFEPVHEKTNNLGFQPGPTQTSLYSHRRWSEAGNFGFRK